jgi:L-2-hydroxyglutarate oxidase LhgO
VAAVTREEFQGWLEHPVTVQLKKQIKKDFENMQAMLLSCDEEDLKELQGRCKAALNLLDMEYESLYE